MKKQPGAPFSVIQDIFKLPYPPIRVTPYHEYDLTREIVSQFLNSTKDDEAIGLAPAYDADNILSALAFASSERVLLVYLAHKPPVIKGRYRSGRDLLHDMILRSDRRPKYAFKMDNVATALCLDLGFRIARAIDILSASQDFRHSMAGLKSVLGGEASLNKANLAALFKHNENICAPAVQIALQAWTAWRAGTLPAMTARLARVPRIDTRAFPEPQLYALSKLAWVARRLEDIKPTRVENEVDSEFSYQGGKLSVTSTRFRTRVLASHNQRIEVESTVGGKVSKFSGKTIFVDGRAARIALTAALGDSIRVTTVGREGPNRAEVQREDIVRNVLQHKSALLKQPFFTALWVARDEPDWTKTPRTEHEVELYFPHAALNPSQRAAVRAILSNEDIDRITLVQGPPGTGKTTVIAAAVVSIVSCAHDIERTVWVVAQSNVAVKNIAEKLAGVDCEFTLVVSKG
ncbi:hypothetical protein DFH06DRAFT_975177 [Mycena polygramma]|nr:hypothetical protein DFH06DRAFT_975177 [Mycena polygramma]